MNLPKPEDIRITYTSQSADMEAAHIIFDRAVAAVRAEAGREHPLYIGGKAVTPNSAPIVDTSPIDTSLVLGRFAAATAGDVDAAMRAAAGAKADWRRLGWRGRVAILRNAAKLVRQRKFELAAVMSLEVGKNRMESLGDAEESGDLIDYYCDQIESANGFEREMNRITPIETNMDVLRPFGVFACIAPFNFPAALSAGMSSAALVAGNTVVYKPAQDTPLTGLKLYEIYRDAGVPDGVFNFVTGYGSVIGDPLWQHPWSTAWSSPAPKKSACACTTASPSGSPSPACWSWAGRIRPSSRRRPIPRWRPSAWRARPSACRGRSVRRAPAPTCIRTWPRPSSPSWWVSPKP